MKVLLAGGGTSGHIHPALAIADKILMDYPDSHIEFCGNESGIENTVIPQAGYKLNYIPSAGFKGKPSFRWIKALLTTWLGYCKARAFIKKFNPDIVIGTGGYVCVPVILAASHLNKKTMLHEQNALPGKSNRFLSGKVDLVCTSFPGLDSFFPKAKKIVETGNPVRQKFFEVNSQKARESLHLKEDEFFLFAMGGSLGAKTINQAIIQLKKSRFSKPIKIVLATGKEHFRDLQSFQTTEAEKSQMQEKNEEQEAVKLFSPCLEIKEYVYNPENYMAAANLLVARAGAICCSEIAAIGVPSLLVPYPYAAGDHQTFNAKIFSQVQGAYQIEDKFLNGDYIETKIKELMDYPLVGKAMAIEAKKLSRPHAVEDLTRLIYELVGLSF